METSAQQWTLVFYLIFCYTLPTFNGNDKTLVDSTGFAYGNIFRLPYESELSDGLRSIKIKAQALYIINFIEIAYHQNKVLYIIKSQRNTPSVMIYTLKRDDIRLWQ